MPPLSPSIAVDTPNGIVASLQHASRVRLPLERYEVHEPFASFLCTFRDVALEGLSGTRPRVILYNTSGLEIAYDTSNQTRQILRLDGVDLQLAEGLPALNISGALYLRREAVVTKLGGGGTAAAAAAATTTIEDSQLLVIQEVDGVSGRVRYVLPAPLGSHVPGGRLRQCSELKHSRDEYTSLPMPCEDGDQLLVDFEPSCYEGVCIIDPVFRRGRLPHNCSAGRRLGDRQDVAYQRDGLCSDLCPTGHYCPPGSSSPTACPPGSFNPEAGGGSLGACIKCPRGSYCGLRAKDHHYCPNGQYNDREGQAKCEECPTGESCLRTSHGGSVKPSAEAPCSKGAYCPDQKNCGEHPEDCEICPRGHQCDGSVKEECPDGTHSINGGDEYCTPCPAGR